MHIKHKYERQPEEVLNTVHPDKQSLKILSNGRLLSLKTLKNNDQARDLNKLEEPKMK